MHNTDLLSQPRMASWGSELMLSVIVDGSCCHTLVLQELSFPAALLGHSSQSPLVIVLLEAPVFVVRGRGTRVGSNNKILNLDKAFMSQMREEFLPVSGFVQLPSQGFLRLQCTLKEAIMPVPGSLC